MLFSTRGQSGAVYVEHDFTLTTSGALSSASPATDELGNGWLVDSGFNYQSGNTGVSETSGSGASTTWIETDGRVDVRLEATLVLSRGSAAGAWNGLVARGTGTANGDGLAFQFNGDATDPNLILRDGTINGGTSLNTWDLSVEMTTPPDEGDTVDVIIDMDGNDITLVSITVNGGSPESIDSTYTLTGTPATNHGASSGADRYGLSTNEQETSSVERWEYFKIGALP